jgi:hypothetical protein
MTNDSKELALRIQERIQSGYPDAVCTWQLSDTEPRLGVGVEWRGNRAAWLATPDAEAEGKFVSAIEKKLEGWSR